MFKRIIFFIAGLILICFVIHIGILSSQDSSYVVWFGICAAIIVPIGFTLIGFSFKRNDKKLYEKLSKIPDIEKLIMEAETQEEKIKLLEDELKRITEIVKFESRKQAILERKNILEQELLRIFNELKSIDQELSFFNINNDLNLTQKEIEELYTRIKARNRGEIVIPIGKNNIIFNNDLFAILPFGLNELIILGLKKLTEKLFKIKFRGVK